MCTCVSASGVSGYLLCVHPGELCICISVLCLHPSLALSSELGAILATRTTVQAFAPVYPHSASFLHGEQLLPTRLQGWQWEGGLEGRQWEGGCRHDNRRAAGGLPVQPAGSAAICASCALLPTPSPLRLRVHHSGDPWELEANFPPSLVRERPQVLPLIKVKRGAVQKRHMQTSSSHL